ncbi:hypothetical protein [Bartonella sp. OT172YNZD]|uniref:hypothetical protein n=1 Tax=Bartonella sp. OT172YNZD TaxID=3243572 RepID=UPI0035CEB304
MENENEAQSILTVPQQDETLQASTYSSKPQTLSLSLSHETSLDDDWLSGKEILANYEQYRSEQEKIVAAQACKIEPNKAGRICDLSAKTGLETRAIANNLDYYLEHFKQREYFLENFSSYSAFTRRMIKDPWFAATIQDDLRNLHHTESTLEGWARAWNIGSIVFDLNAIHYKEGIGTATDEDLKRRERLEAELQKLGTPYGFLQNVSLFVAQLWKPVPEAFTFGTIAMAAGAGIGSAPGATMGFGAGFAASYIEQMYRQIYGSSYHEMTQAGVPKEKAMYFAAGIGLLGTAVGAGGLKVISKPLTPLLSKLVAQTVKNNLTQLTTRQAAVNFVKNAATMVGVETGVNVAQEATQILGVETAKASSNIESLFATAEGRLEIAQRLLDTAGQTASTMIVLAPFPAAARFVYDAGRANMAQRQKRFINDLSKLTLQSKVRNRSLYAYETVLADQAKDMGAENIYIDAAHFNTVLNQKGISREELKRTLSEVEEQLELALDTGGDIVIPTEKYASQIATTDLGAGLIDHVRLDPEAMSTAEAKSFLDEQQGHFDKAVEDLAQNMLQEEKFSRDAQEVEKRFLKKIKDTRIYSHEASKAFASLVKSFITTQAKELNMMPSAFYERYLYGFQSPFGKKDLKGAASHGLSQGNRGGFDPSTFTTLLTKDADYSTFLHETGHFFLTVYSDLAAMKDVPHRFKEDMQTLLEWFGVKDLKTWKALSLEQQRPYHEQFAYNFELYLSENKAPNAGLQKLFHKFATWLRTVYRSIRDDLNTSYRQEVGKDLPLLTGEVGRVMDRMLAGEDQVTQASAFFDIPLYESQKISGMSTEQWQDYLALHKETKEAAATKLAQRSVNIMRWESKAKSKHLKKIQAHVDKTRKMIEAEVTQEMMKRPVYRAINFLRYGKELNEKGKLVEVAFPAKLSIDSVEALYPNKETRTFVKKALGYGHYGMLAREGISAEVIAEMFGYKTAKEMITDIQKAPSFKEAVHLETDRQMIEKHSDFFDEKAHADAINNALHNDLRAQLIAAELRHAEQSTVPLRVFTQGTKRFARRVLSNHKIKDLKPYHFALAERRAAKEALEAMRKGNAEVVVTAKRQQILLNQLAREAEEIKQEIDKGLKNFEKIFAPDKKLAKTRDMGYVNAARSVLSFFGLAQGKQTLEDFLAHIKEYNSALYEEILPKVLTATLEKTKYPSMTVEDFRIMREAVNALWHQSRRDKIVQIEGKSEFVSDVVDHLVEQMNDLGIKDEEIGSTRAVTEFEKKKRLFGGLRAALVRVEHWADLMDGANKVGQRFFTEKLVRPVIQAVDRYTSVRNEKVKHYIESLKNLDLPKGKIEAYELGYTFKNKAELLGALLHTGNESNLRKLLLGREWGEINLDKALNSERWQTFQSRMIHEGYLTKADFDFAQTVWDLNETMKHDAQKVHYDIFGYYFKEVEATPIITPWGEYKGGYVPAKTDPFMVRKEAKGTLESLQDDFRYALPSTGLGFTKTRVEYNKPLSLDLRLMARHIDDVVRFIYVQPAIQDALKIINNRKFKDTMNRYDPSVLEGVLMPWLERVATQQAVKNGALPLIDSVMKGVRSRTGAALMFGNFVNVAQQVLGIFPAAIKVRPKYLVEGFRTVFANPRETAQTICQLSHFMDNRLKQQIYTLYEAGNDILLNPNIFQKMDHFLKRNAYFMQTAVQNKMDLVVWHGVYTQALERMGKGLDETAAQKEAIAQADAAVRMTQDSFAPQDMAAYQVSTPFANAFTQFTSYFNMLYNLQGSEMRKAVREAGLVHATPQLFHIALMGSVIPAIASGIIMRTFNNSWKERDVDEQLFTYFAGYFFADIFEQELAKLPFAGSIINTTWDSLTGGGYQGRFASNPSFGAMENSTVGLARGLRNLIDVEREVTGKNVRDFFTAIQTWGGFPLAPFGKPFAYMREVERGRKESENIFDFGRGLITGR